MNTVTRTPTDLSTWQLNMGLRHRLTMVGKRWCCIAWCSIAFLGIVEAINYSIDHQYWAILGRFFLQGESNVPTWFSSALSLSCAAMFLLLHLEDASLRRAGRLFRYGWVFLMLIFLFLSVDETAMLHEELHRVMRKWVLHEDVRGPGSLSWYHLYAVVGMPVALYTALFIFRYARDTRLVVWWVLAGVLLGLALRLEPLSDWGPAYIVEECAEMAASVSVFRGALSYWERHIVSLADSRTSEEGAASVKREAGSV